MEDDDAFVARVRSTVGEVDFVRLVALLQSQITQGIDTEFRRRTGSSIFRARGASAAGGGGGGGGRDRLGTAMLWESFGAAAANLPEIDFDPFALTAFGSGPGPSSDDPFAAFTSAGSTKAGAPAGAPAAPAASKTFASTRGGSGKDFRSLDVVIETEPADPGTDAPGPAVAPAGGGVPAKLQRVGSSAATPAAPAPSPKLPPKKVATRGALQQVHDAVPAARSFSPRLPPKKAAADRKSAESLHPAVKPEGGTSSETPEFLKKLATFQRRWDDLGLAASEQGEDAVDDVLATMTALSAGPANGAAPGATTPPPIATGAAAATLPPPPEFEPPAAVPAVRARRLSTSVSRGELSATRASRAARHIDTLLRRVISAVELLRAQDDNPFGRDVTCAMLTTSIGDAFVDLPAMLLAGRRRGVLGFKGLPHSEMIVKVLQPTFMDSTPDDYTFEDIRSITVSRDGTESPKVPLKAAAAGTATRYRSESMTRRAASRAAAASIASQSAGRMGRLDPELLASARAQIKAGYRPRLGSTDSELKEIISISPDADALVDVMASVTAIAHSASGAPAERPDAGRSSDTPMNPISAAGRLEGSAVMNRKLSVSVERGDLSAKRALAAARWVDKELRKLIGAIIENGTPDGDGCIAVSFTVLFKATENEMEALAGTLRAARRKKVVQYENNRGSDVLFQGVDDAVVITLLESTIPDSTVDTYTYQHIHDVASGSVMVAKTTGFDHGWTPGITCADPKCGKTVYQAEYVGASGKAFCRRCFRCEGSPSHANCNSQLKQNDYNVGVDGKFRCNTCHRDAEMPRGVGAVLK